MGTFQYTWFDKNGCREKDKADGMPTPRGYDDIAAVSLSFWAEHCLECAAPLCYNSCPNWVERYDKRCKRFYYGIYNNRQFQSFPFGAELRFRKWGKLEIRRFPGTVSVGTARRLDSLNRILCTALLSVSRLLKPVSPTCKLNRTFETMEHRFLTRFRRENAWIPKAFSLRHNRRGDADMGWVGGAFMLTRRSLMDELGGFDPAFFMHCEDTDFRWRIRNAGYRIVFSDRCESIHLGGVTSSAQISKKADFLLEAAEFVKTGCG